MRQKISYFITVAALLLLFGTLNGCTEYTKGTASSTSYPMKRPGYSQDSLWPAITSQFSLDHAKNNKAVQAQIAWYAAHPALINRSITQASPFLYYVFEEVKQRDLPGELILLPIIESSYDPNVYSYVGAAGIWQLMPGTAAGLGIKQNWWYDGRRDIDDSTQAALDYLTYLNNFFDEDWLKAIAAYNSGEGTVKNAVLRNNEAGKATDFFALDLPAQTKAYVPKLLALAIIIEHPDRYGIVLPEVPDKPMVARVEVGSQIDLAQAAELADISQAEIYNLNPGYMRWATDPNGETRLFLPAEKVALFQQNLAAIPAEQRVTWQRHTVKSGDTLGGIAKKYDTTVAILRKVNNVKGNTIRLSQVLIVPQTAHSLTKYYLHDQKRYVTKTTAHLPGPKQVVYTVKKGDSFDTIAKKYDVTPAAIVFWNPSTRNVLAVGAEVTLWLNHSQHYAKTTEHYTVKPGDSLAKIAAYYHLDTKTLQKTNRLKSILIKPGQSLSIPPHRGLTPDGATYIVKSGDTLSKIAKQQQVNLNDLMHWNRLSKTDQLHIGQSLKLYS
ncbi:MAG: putative rane-bound lytic murein transglycosylase [Gammaproteobacteria bacterium]|jgi:membrane-bound lytic murein transglycosylase D|nr:putative rane-bound lytic murein transglycosylase [Gammaproteobacteria bacterium]